MTTPGHSIILLSLEPEQGRVCGGFFYLGSHLLALSSSLSPFLAGARVGVYWRLLRAQTSPRREF